MRSLEDIERDATDRNHLTRQDTWTDVPALCKRVRVLEEALRSIEPCLANCDCCDTDVSIATTALAARP